MKNRSEFIGEIKRILINDTKEAYDLRIGLMKYLSDNGVDKINAINISNFGGIESVTDRIMLLIYAYLADKKTLQPIDNYFSPSEIVSESDAGAKYSYEITFDYKGTLETGVHLCIGSITQVYRYAGNIRFLKKRGNSDLLWITGEDSGSVDRMINKRFLPTLDVSFYGVYEIKNNKVYFKFNDLALENNSFYTMTLYKYAIDNGRDYNVPILLFCKGEEVKFDV